MIVFSILSFFPLRYVVLLDFFWMAINMHGIKILELYMLYWSSFQVFISSAHLMYFSCLRKSLSFEWWATICQSLFLLFLLCQNCVFGHGDYFSCHSMILLLVVIIENLIKFASVQLLHFEVNKFAYYLGLDLHIFYFS